MKMTQFKVVSMRTLADLGVIVCLISCAWLWQAISPYQPMWPAPALYLIEMAVLSLVGWLGVRRSETDRSSAGLWLTWAVIGAFAAFAMLGALSIGSYFVPTALLFAGAALWFEYRQPGRLILHLAVCGLAVLAQGALMLVQFYLF